MEQSIDSVALARGAVVGGVINLICDLALSPGWGPGSATGDPERVVLLLSQVPMGRVVAATLVGALAISSWTLAAPALVSLVRPAGRWLAGAVGLLHIWIVGGCVAFHVVFGSMVWGAGAGQQLEPMWTSLGGMMVVLFGGFFFALAGAAWRNPALPRWLPFASPLFGMTVLPGIASQIPSPLGLPMALSASTMGAVLWLLVIQRCAAAQAKSGTP